jgi:hypothetical protein
MTPTALQNYRFTLLTIGHGWESFATKEALTEKIAKASAALKSKGYEIPVYVIYEATQVSLPPTLPPPELTPFPPAAPAPVTATPAA